MTGAGLAQVEAARADGRWKVAYNGSAAMVIPQDFLDALAAIPVAEAFYRTLDRKDLYSIYYGLQTAKKPETRARRMQQILDQLLCGERFRKKRLRYPGQPYATAKTQMRTCDLSFPFSSFGRRYRSPNSV